MTSRKSEGQNRPRPRYVEQTFRAYLDSGMLAKGVLRAFCAGCGTDLRIAFSCNVIRHPDDQPGQPYHPYCRGRPAGAHGAAVFRCEDTDAGGLTTNWNLIDGNQLSSYYGILSIGADEFHPYWAPRLDTFTHNTVMGSDYGCAEDFAPGQWSTDYDGWVGNDGTDSPDTGPT